MASHTGDVRRTPRRGLAIYFAVLMVLSSAIEALIILNPHLDGLIATLMLVPATASVAARLALKEGFSDVSFRFGRDFVAFLTSPHAGTGGFALMGTYQLVSMLSGRLGDC